MKKKKHKNNDWKNFPEELRLMCLAEVRGRGRYCTEAALKYLADHMNDCDSFIFGTTPRDVIRWIDTSIEMCLFPLEHYEEEWIERKDDIRQVLERSEELLKRIAPKDYKDGYRMPDEKHHKMSIIEYAQKLDVYFCVLYMFTEELQKLQERLDQLLAYTEQNVEHMMSCEDVEEYVSWDDWAEYHYPGTDASEPLNWLCREYFPGFEAKKLLAQTYEKYVLFLHTLCSRLYHTSACLHLWVKAEKRLGGLCTLILDEVYECLEETGADEGPSLIADKEQYETMLERSNERIAAENNEDTAASEMTGDVPGKNNRPVWENILKLTDDDTDLPFS